MMGAVLFAAGSIGVQAAPVVVSIAGSGPVGWDNGLSAGNGTAALDSFLNGPTGVARASDGRLIVADYGNDLIRSINTSGIISTLGGDGWPGNQGNGTALGTSLWGPWGVAMRGTTIVFTDAFNSSVRAIQPDGSLVRLAGVMSGSPGNTGDPYGGWSGFDGDGGAATSAHLSWPMGIATDGAGNIYVADSWNQRIRRITPDGTISTVAGNGWSDAWGRGRFSGDGGPATAASLNWPAGVSVDAQGNLFIADTYNHRIRRVDAATKTISTVAGTGEIGNGGDGGPALSAQLNHPSGLAIAPDGRLFIADTMNHRIRVVEGGQIAAVAGDGQRGLAGDNGLAAEARFNEPRALTLSAVGDLVVADTGNSRIRMVMFGETAPLSGVVRDWNTLAPIPGAVVSWNGIRAEADAEGRYTIPVYQGPQDVRAQKPTFGTVVEAVTVGPNPTSHDFLLPSGFLQARVVDDAGHVVPDALVKAGDNLSTSGPDGLVTLRLAPGPQSVAVSRDGYGTPGPLPVNITNGLTTPALLTLYRVHSVRVPLAWDKDWASFDTNPGDYTTAAGDFAFSADELPAANSVFSLATSVGSINFDFPNTRDGAANVLTVNGQAISVPTARYTAVRFLEAGQFGAFTGSVTLRYADGGTESIQTKFSDWAWNAVGQSLGLHETVAISCTHRHNATDNNAGPPVDVLMLTLPVDPNRPLSGVSLPADPSKGTADPFIFALSLDALGGPMYGDVDAGGSITPADAHQALIAAAGLGPITGDAKLRADLWPVYEGGGFGDGVISLEDAMAIARAIQ